MTDVSDSSHGYYLWLWRPIVYHQRYKVAEDSNFLVC